VTGASREGQEGNRLPFLHTGITGASGFIVRPRTFNQLTPSWHRSVDPDGRGKSGPLDANKTLISESHSIHSWRGHPDRSTHRLILSVGLASRRTRKGTQRRGKILIWHHSFQRCLSYAHFRRHRLMYHSPNALRQDTIHILNKDERIHAFITPHRGNL